MLKIFIWGLIRLSVVIVFVYPVVHAIVIMAATALPQFTVDIRFEVVVWLSSLISVLGYIFIRTANTKEVGKFILLSMFGSIVLTMYEGDMSGTFPFRYISSSLFLAVLCLIMMVYFVFPIRQLKPFMFLVPISASSWLMYKSIYLPSYYAYYFFSSKPSISSDIYEKIISKIPQIFLDGFISGLFSLGLLCLYFFSLYGHNPKTVYKNVTIKLTKERNN
ncbi:Putative uncharacterized protein [Moritella viscosa]|nr:membrane protein [Moritella viscosa]SHO01540.1 Putative uncharacterized protein [Moritella viscosa]SHO20529.1 Putative uncharacterized protein [Moritella viscosa]